MIARHIGFQGTSANITVEPRYAIDLVVGTSSKPIDLESGKTTVRFNAPFVRSTACGVLLLWTHR